MTTPTPTAHLSPKKSSWSLAVLLSTFVLLVLGLTAPGVGAAGENPSSPEESGDQRSAAPFGDPSTKSPRARYLAVAERVPTFGGVFVTGMERSEDGPRLFETIGGRTTPLFDEGRVQVWLTDTGSSTASSRAREAIAHHFPQSLRDRPIDFVQAEHQFVDLVAWEKDLIDLLNKDGVNSLGISQSDNRLKVGVDDVEALRPTIEAEAAESGIPLGALLVVERGPLEPELESSHRPLVGGLQFTHSTAAVGGEEGPCTMGFIAEIDGVSGFITASHCSDTIGEVDGSNYYQPHRGKAWWTNFIGTERIDPPFGPHGLCPAGRQCKMSDASFIEKNPAVDSALGFVARPPYKDNKWDGERAFMVTGNYQPFEGDMIDFVGRKSGWGYGHVREDCVHINVNDKHRAVPAANLTLLCQMIADYPSQGGDSGGAVFNWVYWGTFDEIGYSGVHSGSIDDGDKAVFSSQYYVRHELWSGSDFHICHPHSQTHEGC